MKQQLLRFPYLLLITLFPLDTLGQTLEKLKGTTPVFAGSTGFYKSSDTLYFTNGTSAGTVAVYKGAYFFEGELRRIISSKIGASYLFYSLNKGGTLSKSDGTVAGTSDIRTNFSAGTTAVMMQNLLYFSGSDNLSGSLWKSDGTTAGTVPVKNTALVIDVLFALGNKLLLSASESSGSTEKIGRELWVSDGTDQGTRLLKDIFPGVNTSGSAPAPNQSLPRLFTQVGNKAVFVANDDGVNYRMWVTDGTEAGTILLQPDRVGLSPRYLGINAKDGILYFVRKIEGKTWELWGTDGTPGGTQKVDLGSIQDASALNYLLTDDGFFYINGTQIRQITNRQSSLVTDVKPLINSSTISSNPILVGYQKGIYYVAYAGDNRIARIDGTASGSYILTNATSGFEYCNLGGGRSPSLNNSYQELFFTVNGKAYLHEYPNGTGTLFTRIDQKNGKDVRVEIYNKNTQFDYYPGSVVLLTGKYVGMAWEGNNTSNFFPLSFNPGTLPAQTCFLKAAVSGNSIYGPGSLPLPCTVNGTTSLSAVTTEGTAPFSYQWQRNGVAINGATAATYAAGSVGDYTVQITDGQSCSTLSASRTVVAAQPISVTLGGDNVVCTQILSSINYAPSLRANTSGGTAPFSYRWALAGKPLSSTTAEQRVSQGGVYSLTVTDACASSVVSKTLTETVLAVTVNGGGGSCTGQPVALTASTTGGQIPYTYDWYFNNGPRVATTSILAATATSGSYRVVTTSADGCSWFTDVQKGSTYKPVTATITGSATLCSGQSSPLSASLTNGTGPFTYVWKQNGAVVGTNSALLNTTTGGIYSLSVTDACSSTTASFTISEAPGPSVSINGALTVCTGQSTTLTAAATGGTGAYMYQWKQGNDIVGTNSPSLMATGGNSYGLTVTDAKGCAITTTISLSSGACITPTVSLPAAGSTATAPLTLTANTGLAGGADTGATYQWLLNGNPVPGAINSTYTASASGSYAVVVALNGRVTTSPAVALTINVVLAIEPIGLAENQVVVYPNPTLSECLVTIEVATRQIVHLLLMDAVGKSVRQWSLIIAPKMSPVRLTLPDAAGLYFLRINTERGAVVKKILRVN